MAVSENTSITLLERSRDPGSHDAWERFAAFCQPVICRYARQLGCHAAMCQDIAQETLVALIRIMATFRYDPAHGRFRSCLYQIRHRLGAALRRIVASIENDIEVPHGP